MAILPKIPRLFENNITSLSVPRVISSAFGSTEEKVPVKTQMTVEDVINEVEEVNEHVSSAIKNTQNDNLDGAIHDLVESARITSCGLCKRELTRNASLLNHAKTTCAVGFEDECNELKNEAVGYIEEFGNKLPKRTEIKKQLLEE